MPGADSEQAILQMIKEGQPNVRATLLGVLADRPTPAAVAALDEAAHGTDTRSAVEAVRALGRVGGAAERADLIKLMVTTQNDSVRDTAKDAVVSIGQHVGDRNSAAGPLLAALPGASGAGKAALLSALADTGGDRALDELTRATDSSDAAVKQAAITALAETWSDTRPLPTLMHLAKDDSSKETRVQALRGYLRLVGGDDRMSGDDKAGRVSQALAVAERPEEKRQALGILRDVRVPQSIEISAKLLDDPAVFNEAADTVLYLAAPQRKNNRDEAAVTGPATNAALDKVAQLTKDDNQRTQAQKLKS